MNMLNITGLKVAEVKARIIALQKIVATTELSIQNKHDSHNRRRQINTQGSARMTPAEFLSLYPSQPSTATEDAEIATKTTELSAARVARPVGDHGKITNHMNYVEEPIQNRIDELKTTKQIKLDNYNRNKSAPEGPLSVAQFDSLYPEPSTGTESAAIATAQAECNALHSFLKTGPSPHEGLYDVDLLTGTTITYP